MERNNKNNAYALLRAVSSTEFDEPKIRIKSHTEILKFMSWYENPSRNKSIRCWKSQSKKTKQWMK